MIKFLLTNWWIYIPIITVLLFLTAIYNQQIERLARERKLQQLSPEERQAALMTELKRKPGKFEKLTQKLGLRGILGHIFPKR